MKRIKFTKMAGAGNDFIVIDSIKGVNLRKLAVDMCSRTDGIGADGLLVYDKSRKTDYKMQIINADGSVAEMCGNGARCMAAYISKLKTPRRKQFGMETLAGIIGAVVNKNNVQVQLSNPARYCPDIALSLNGRKIKVSYIDTGVPHTIVYVDNLSKINVELIGRQVRTHKKFLPRGANVDFVEQINKNLVEVRTYERGVESETRACGTGSVAAAIVTFLKSNPKIKSKKNAFINVLTKSGEILKVTFDINNGKISNVWLKGSAKFIAKGEYYA